MTFQPRCHIPGLPEEAQRALADVQNDIARECSRLSDSSRRTKRRVTELVEEGAVIAKPGEVVRVQPGDEDVTVYLPEPGPGNAGEDIVVAFEGDGTATGKIRVAPMNGTCALPGVQTLNAPGQYRFTSTGAPTAKPVSSRWTAPSEAAAGSPSAGTWAAPPPVTVDDLPPIDTDSLVENAVDNTILDDMPAQSVKVNATGSAGDPTDLVLGPLSVLGRRGTVVSSGNIESIDVPDTSQFTGSSVFLRSPSTRTSVSWRPLTLVDFPQMADNRFMGNLEGATGFPVYYSLDRLNSNTIIYENTGKTFIREALTGDVTALQNSNVTTIEPLAVTTGKIADDAVTDGKLRKSAACSVIGRATNSVGNPADIAALTNDRVLARRSDTLVFTQVVNEDIADGTIQPGKLAGIGANTILGNDTASTLNPLAISVGTNTVLGRVAANIVAAQLVNAQITDGTIANAKLANMAAGSTKGRAVTAGTGVPTDLSGAQTAGLLRFAVITDTSSNGTITTYAPTGLAADTTGIRISPAGNVVLRGMALADGQQIAIRVGRSSAFTVTLNSEDASAAADTERFNTPGNVNLVLRAGEAAIIRYTESRNNVLAVGRTSVADADYGDITVSANGATWTIDNNVVSDAKLRDSAALSVIGRSANSSGDPADIAGSASSDAVLRISGTTLGFGTVATAGIADNAATNAKIRDSGALSVIGRSANSSGDPADISATAASGAVLRESGSVLGFGTIATAGIADAAVTNAKLANMAAGTVKGKQIDASTGAPVDLTSLEVGELIGFGTIVNTAGLTGTQNLAINADTDYVILNTTGDVTLASMTSRHEGALVFFEHLGPNLLTVPHNSGSATLLPFATANGVSVTVPARTHFWLVRRGGFWRFAFPGKFTSTTDGLVPLSGGGTVNFLRADGTWTTPSPGDGDKGDITVSSSGATWTIDNNVITDGKLRDSAALSVIGRSVNSSGDPGDITAGTNDRVLVRRSNTLVFDQIVVGDIADGIITVAKLAGIGANTILGNDTAGTLTPNAISVGTNTVLGRVAGNIVAAQLATGQVASNAITDGKLRQSAARSVIGRTNNSTGDVADISAVSGSDNALREVGGTLGFGTLATGAYGNNSVTNAKLAQMAQSTIRGRASGAGTGDVTDLTAGQVVSIIESTLEARDLDFTGTNSLAGTTTFSGNITVNARMLLFGSQTLTPASSQNDMAVSSTVTVVRMDPSAHIFVTGIVPSADGHFLLLINVSPTFNITLVNESASSSAANRIGVMDNGSASDGLHLRARGGSCVLWYDGVSDRWRPVSMWNLITVSGGPT